MFKKPDLVSQNIGVSQGGSKNWLSVRTGGGGGGGVVSQNERK